MSKIQTATKNNKEKAAPVKVVQNKEKTKTEGKERAKVPAFNKAHGRIARSLAAITKAASYIEQLAGVLPDDHAGKAAITGSLEGLSESKTWLGIVVKALDGTPKGTVFPGVKGAGGGRGALIAGAKVIIKPTRAEVYEGLFAEDEEQVLTVHALVAGGKRIVCKTSQGLRQVIPAAHLKLYRASIDAAKAGEEDEEDEAAE